MEKDEMEQIVFDAANRAAAGQGIESDFIEMKLHWPPVTHGTARRIAALCNAAASEFVLLLIGIGEEGQVHDTRGQPAAWWDQMKKHFDGDAPSASFLTVGFRGVTLTGVFFRTADRPFVTRFLGSGPQSYEVPWRSATSTRSARRSELLGIMPARATTPRLSILRAELTRTYVAPEQRRTNGQQLVDGRDYIWSIRARAYFTMPTLGPIVFPLHHLEIQLSQPPNEPIFALAGKHGQVFLIAGNPREKPDSTIEVSRDQILALNSGGVSIGADVWTDAGTLIPGPIVLRIHWRSASGDVACATEIEIPSNNARPGTSKWVLSAADGGGY